MKGIEKTDRVGAVSLKEGRKMSVDFDWCCKSERRE